MAKMFPDSIMPQGIPGDRCGNNKAGQVWRPGQGLPLPPGVPPPPLRLPASHCRLATMQHPNPSRPRKSPRGIEVSLELGRPPVPVPHVQPRPSPLCRGINFPNISDLGRRKRVLSRPAPDTFRVFNIELPERNKMLEKIESINTSKKKQQRYTVEWRNNPHPTHIKWIKTNTKYINEPVMYMDTEETKTKQDDWWPSGEPFVQRPKPPYDKQSTQRNDFQKPRCMLSRPVKYNLQPSRGIVPLTSPRPPGSLPRLFQEQLTFNQNYDARTTPRVPYQGKKRGTLVWKEINPGKGTAAVPEGTKTPLCLDRGSASLEPLKTEKGSAAKTGMTSACVSLPASQETLPDSKMALSKPDVMVGAETGFTSSGKGQESSEV